MNNSPPTPARESARSPFRRTLRANKLVKPRLQLRLIGGFFGVGLLALLLELLLLGRELTEFSRGLTGEAGLALAEAIPSLLRSAAVTTAFVLAPLMLLIGSLITSRVAGPVYRFERFLADVAAGKQTEPCRLRDGDELGELCERINAVTEPLRQQEAERHDRRRSA